MRLPFKNQMRFAGYVGNVPELRHIAGGVPVVTLRIVAKHSYKDGNDWKTVEEWMTAAFYRKHAEAVTAAGIGQGAFLDITGRHHTRKWIGEDQRPRSAPELIVEEWHPVDLASLGVRALPSSSPPSSHAGAEDAASPAAVEPRRAAASAFRSLG